MRSFEGCKELWTDGAYGGWLSVRIVPSSLLDYNQPYKQAEDTGLLLSPHTARQQGVPRALK